MQYETFDEYWLAYLAAHSRPATRACHYIGTVVGLFISLITFFTVAWWVFFVLGFFGYGLALLSHPLFEGNRPFAKKPLWGLASDIRMLLLAIVNRLQPHLIRALRSQ